MPRDQAQELGTFRCIVIRSHQERLGRQYLNLGHPYLCKLKAFLSHSSEDSALATALFKEMRNKACPVWFDRIELRPGDSLLDKIGKGVAESDVFLVLISLHSVYSDWVQKEIRVALDSKCLRIIPLLLRPDVPDVPDILSHLYYISISKEDLNFRNIISGIFRDSFVLNLRLDPANLDLVEKELTDNLYEFVRSDFEKVIVNLDNLNFNTKIDHIVSMADKMGYVEGMVEQIRDNSRLFHIHLPLYWSNLCRLLGDLATEVFATLGKNVQAVPVAEKAVIHTFRYSQLMLVEDISYAVFEDAALKTGHDDIARLRRDYSNYIDHTQPISYVGKLEREILEVGSEQNVAQLELAPKNKHVPQITKIMFPITKDDSLYLQGYMPPSQFFNDYDWYVHVVPQLLRNYLRWSIYKEGKPVHELRNKFAFKKDRYLTVGHA